MFFSLIINCIKNNEILESSLNSGWNSLYLLFTDAFKKRHGSTDLLIYIQIKYHDSCKGKTSRVLREKTGLVKKIFVLKSLSIKIAAASLV